MASTASTTNSRPVPALFTDGKFRTDPDLAGSCEHCCVCGRRVTGTQSWVRTAYGADPVPVDAVVEESGDSGSFPVGPECGKRFPAGYLYKSSAPV